MSRPKIFSKLKITLLVLLLTVCVSLHWRWFSAEENDAQGDLGRDVLMAIESETLSNRQHSIECPVRIGVEASARSRGKLSVRTLRREDPVPAASKSAMDSFVVHRHVQPAGAARVEVSIIVQQGISTLQTPKTAQRSRRSEC